MRVRTSSDPIRTRRRSERLRCADRHHRDHDPGHGRHRGHRHHHDLVRGHGDRLLHCCRYHACGSYGLASHRYHDRAACRRARHRYHDRVARRRAHRRNHGTGGHGRPRHQRRGGPWPYWPSSASQAQGLLPMQFLKISSSSFSISVTRFAVPACRQRTKPRSIPSQNIFDRAGRCRQPL